jgi:hypothetical protein
MTVKEIGPRRGNAAGLFSRLPKFFCLWYVQLMTQTFTTTDKLPQPANLVGTWRRFGSVGPVYEIIGSGKELTGGDRLMRVRVIETGEEVDYRLAEILDDPRER